MTNDALSNYMALQLKIEEQLEALKLQLDAVQDSTMPEDIHWGHVSDLNHISATLANMLNPE